MTGLPRTGIGWTLPAAAVGCLNLRMTRRTIMKIEIAHAAATQSAAIDPSSCSGGTECNAGTSGIAAREVQQVSDALPMAAARI